VANDMTRTGRRKPGPDWLWPALALFFVAAPVVFWRGQVIDEEALGLLRKYWSERSFLQKVFDPRGWDFYQGRELSYAIDFLDARWTRLLAAREVIFFLPPSAVLASVAFVVLGAWLAPRALPGLDRATRWLVLLLLLSSFVFLSTMGMQYRATKPLVAPLLLALLLLVVAEHRHPRLGPRAAFTAVFVTSLAMSLLDRQGLFYVLLVGLALGLAWIRTRRGLPLVLGAATACGVWLLYFHFLGPRLIQALNGYRPETRFQRLNPARLLEPQPWLQAIELLGDWSSVLLGGLPPALLAGATLAGGAVWAWRTRDRPRRVAVAAALTLAGTAGQVTMVAMMAQRHPPVMWIANRLWYYPFPYQALVVFGLLWGLDRLAARGAGSLPRSVPWVLAALVVLNVAQWPERRCALESDFSEELRRSALLVRSLRSGHAEPLLDGDYRRFYFDCLDLFPRLAARALPQVGEGGGVFKPEVRDGRVVAWAEHQAHLTVRTKTAGRYVLAGGARLRPGDTLQFLVGTPPRLLHEIRRAPPGEGDKAFRVAVELGAGVSDIQLLSRLPEIRIPGDPRRTTAGFMLLLPVALLPDGPPLPAP
jgi:hypothetical protein